VLDLSKIEAGKMELAIEEINIVDTINSVMSTAIGLVKDKPVRLEKELAANIPMVRGDAMRLRQVLLNLIGNAAKFTEEGKITIEAAPHVSSTGVQEVLVSVRDTGPGISAEDQAKLFQAFSQVDSSPTRKSGGTGLGLSICHRMIELHGGRIGAHSVVGEGSTFYFTVPVYRQENLTGEPGDKVILCIDDDPQIINLYERYLKPQGYHVVPLVNPANAKDTIKRLKPYAITLDIMMPEIDGWQVLTDLKNDPETRDIPIIVCSIVEEEEKGFSMGASDYLVKPILQDDLLAALNRLNGDGAIQEVLIIDDSADDLRLIERIISEKDAYRPILAQGGKKGWELIMQKKPQAIILDLFMPDLDGFEILERLKTSPDLLEIPVLVISGAELNDEQKQKLDNLGKQMLKKGMLDQDELFNNLEKALKRLATK
jgi:CheY-like chemotaxis protein